MATKKRAKDITRRDFMKTAGALALAAGMGANIILPGGAGASKKKLNILQWTHTDSDFNWWFQNYCKQWGKKNDTEVNLELASE
jgi:spermidine/putrescine-binding protein